MKFRRFLYFFALAHVGNGDEAVEAAMAQIARVCNSYPWITCKLPFRRGSYGGGMVAIFRNDPKTTGVDFYMNCPFTPKDPEGFAGGCTARERIEPSERPELHVFMKVVFGGKFAMSHLGFEEIDQLGRVRQTDNAKAERLRARAMASSPARVAVDQIDIFVAGTKKAHSLMTKEKLIITAAVFGSTFGDIYHSGGFDNWRQRLSLAAQQWERAASASSSSEQLSNRSGGSLDEKTARDALLAELAWPLASVAMAWRSRLLLLRRAHSYSLHHCDAHDGNIMLHGTTLPADDPVALRSAEKLFRAGRVVPIVSGASVIFSLPWEMSVAPALQEGHEMKLLGVAAADLVFIDTAFSLQLPEGTVKKAGGKRYVNGPCAIWRPNRCEDLAQWWRADDKLERMTLALQVAIRSFEEGVSRKAGQQQHGERFMQLADKVVEPMRALQSAWTSFAENVFTGNPEFLSCVNFGYIMDWQTQGDAASYKQDKAWARGRRFFPEWYTEGSRCDLQMMEDATDKFQAHLETYLRSAEVFLAPLGFKFDLPRKYRPGVRSYLTFQDGRRLDFALDPVKAPNRTKQRTVHAHK